MKEAARANLIELDYLDEAGFAPTLPVGYTWAREGVRAIVPYEAPEGRRVNAIGSLAPYGDNPRLEYATRCTSFKGQAVLEFIWRQVGNMSTPVGEVPEGFIREKRCVVVLDNYSPHHGKEIKEQARALEAAGIELFYLPRYAPELNATEYLNNDLKGQVNAAGLPDNKEELRSRMQRFMHKLQRLPQHVRSYFKHPCMLYALAA